MSVVSSENGLEEAKVALMVGPERTIAAFITTGAHHAGPGRIFFGGVGSIRLGEVDGPITPRIRELCGAFCAY